MLGFELQTREPRRGSGVSLVALQQVPTVQPSAWWIPDPQIYLRGRESPQTP